MAYLAIIFGAVLAATEVMSDSPWGLLVVASVALFVWGVMRIHADDIAPKNN